MSGTCSPRAFPSSTCATRKIRARPATSPRRPNTWNIHLQVRGRPAAGDPRQGHVRGRRIRRRARLLQRRARQERRHRGGQARARLERGACGLRRVEAGGAAPHRLHGRRGRRHPPRLVHRRRLGLRLGAARRLHRLHLHDHRHERPGQAARGRALVDPRHEFGRRRNAVMGGRRAATACIIRSCMATPLTVPGATPAWWCSTSPTAPSRS